MDVNEPGEQKLPGPLYDGETRGFRKERHDAVENRRKILGVSQRLFEERGVEAVSMHEIGQEAGVGQGTLYRRFENKGVLCMALLRERTDRFSEEVRARMEGEDPALTQVVWLLGRIVWFSEENAPLLAAIRDAATGEQRFDVYHYPFYRWLRGMVAVLLRRAVADGEARRMDSIDAELLADVIIAPLNINLYLFQRREMGMEPERIAAVLQRFVLDGLRGSLSGGP